MFVGIVEFSKEFQEKGIFRLWLGPIKPAVACINAETVEVRKKPIVNELKSQLNECNYI